jgi:Bacterial Ig-like domain
VLRVSLTGSVGTDFDLYLFDSTATDIYADPPIGLVASSVGPTSTESITYPTMTGGVYYIDLSGATNVEGTYQLAVEIAQDTTPPRCSLVLDGGAPATNDPAVGVTVAATDDLSGVAAMQFSSDGSTWLPWQSYATTTSWTFGPPDGPKQLWARVRDGAGNVSSAARATIDYDTTRPVVIAREPGPLDPITGTQPTISVTFSEPIQVPSWTSGGLVLQDARAVPVYGTFGWSAATNTGTFTPSQPLVAGALYTVSLGGVVDLAGNPLVQIGAWVIQPLVLPRASLAASSAVLLHGSVVTLSGDVTGGLGTPVLLERSGDGSTWTAFETVFPGPGGQIRTAATVDSNTWFRARVLASGTSAEVLSPTVRVLVRRDVRLQGLDAGVTRRVPALSAQRLTVEVAPATPAVPVTLSIYRLVAGRGYVRMSSVTRTTVGGRYTFTWHPGRGTYYVRVSAASTPTFANGISPAYRWVAY